MTNRTESGTDGFQDLLTAKDVARKLQLDVQTVYQWSRNGRLPSVRFGRAVRFKADEVMDALMSE